MLFFINLLYYLLICYVSIGLIVGVIFIFFGSKMDPILNESKKGIRLLLFPATVVLWPFVVFKLSFNRHE